MPHEQGGAGVVSVTDVRSVAQANLLVAGRDLAELFRAFAGADPGVLRDELLDFYPDFVRVYGEQGAALAAESYDVARADARVSGQYRATLAPPVSDAQAVGSARWAIGPAFSGNLDKAFQQLLGASTRLIQQPSRDTMRWNVDHDPSAIGWRREARTGSCQFCRMLAGRGGVYTRQSAFFAAHDLCQCVITPSWDPHAQRIPAPLYEISKRTAGMKPAVLEIHRARVRDYLMAHRDELT